MRNIVRFSIITLILLVTSAWTWPGQKKVKPTAPQPVVSQTNSTVTPAEPVKEDKEIPTQTMDVEILKPPDISPVIPQVPAASVSVPKPVMIPQARPVIAPDQVQTELKQVMELQKQRQKDLESQMQTLRITLERAKTYNKILSNMYPTLPGGSLAARAVNQEKIRLIHEEVRKMAPVAPIPPAVRSAQIISRQASQARTSAFVLPIGKHAPKAPASEQTTTSSSASE